ncbi:hypothetical protein F4779DRAFT_199790 [Xylariaceae sp. FL0662B]|nr:hypothetical protein F4779DRAFT_199790 [Xylariaceae sp. FL0662B]
MSMILGWQQNTELASRAWVIQETILSPRLLSFTNKQVIWQCLETAACEDFPEPEPIVSYNMPALATFWGPTDVVKLLNDDRYRYPKGAFDTVEYGVVKRNNQTRSLEERWLLILEGYSKATLSFPEKDILRAIEGVGNHLAHITGQSYRHGMLSGCIEPSLLWRAYHPNPDFEKSSLVPSWHWASHSISSSVDFSWNVRRLYSMLRNFNCEFAPMAYYVYPSDDNRRLATGEYLPEHWHKLITICCHPPVTTAEMWRYLICIGRLIRVEPEETEWESHVSYVKVVPSALGKTPVMYAQLDYPGLHKITKNSDLAYLPLLIQHNLGSGRNVGCLIGLLFQADGGIRYKRIGTISESFDDCEPHAWNDVLTQPPQMFILIYNAFQLASDNRTRGHLT